MKAAAFSFLIMIGLSVSAIGDVVTIIDTTPGTATNNGSIALNEYIGYSTGINGGFGNIAGSGSSLYVDSSVGGTLSFGFAKGSGTFADHHALVIYIDSVSGGFGSTSSLTDSGDRGRKAVSGYSGTNRAQLDFAGGFQADYAISLESGYAGLWTLKTGTFDNPVSANQSNNGSQWELNLSLANIGLTPGGSFKYVASYIDCDSAYRSNEFHGVASFGDNPGWNTVSLGSYNTFVSVPEASVVLAGTLICSALAAYSTWGRKRTSDLAAAPQ